MKKVAHRTKTAKRSRRAKALCPRDMALAILKAEIVRIGHSGTRSGFLFARSIFKAMPELKDA